MRTLAAGARVLRVSPQAAIPLLVEGVVVAVLILIGAFPRNGASATAGAVFPLDVYFDLKQSLAFTSSWVWFLLAMLMSIAARSLVLALTLWLPDREGSLIQAWKTTARLAGTAAAVLFFVGGLFFTGTAIRYAPFIWIGGGVGLVAAVVLARGAVLLDVGGGRVEGRGVPEPSGYITYAYVVIVFATAMSVLARLGPLPVAVLALCAAPVHAIVLLGWREHARAGTYPGGGAIAVAATVVALSAFALSVGYDRYVRNPPPVGRVEATGTLLLLGGVDSTTTTGALADLDARDVGFPRSAARLLSYSENGSYSAADTRADLEDIAIIVGAQVESVPQPRFLLGHSQASLIVDRVLALSPRERWPDRAAVLAPSVAFPPTVEVPRPDESGTGKPGGDFARAFSWVLEALGGAGFAVDAPASPTNVEQVSPGNEIPRLSVWALADSVWLNGDWRRPGEVNVVAFSDHVGTTENARALAAVRSFFVGEPVEDDESSWRGLLVSALRYAFEPWRPQ